MKDILEEVDRNAKRFMKSSLAVLIIIVLLISSGCAKNPSVVDIQKPEEPIVSQDNVNDRKESDAPQPLKVSDSSYESIKKFLESREDIKDISWSHTSSQVTFTLYIDEPENYNPGIYLWQIGVNEPRVVTSIDKYYFPASFVWSPNDEYVFVNSGTSCIRYGYILSVSDLTIVKEFGFALFTAWSPDSKRMALTRRISMITDTETELEGTTDVVIINIKNKEEKVVKKGAAEYYFEIEKWNEDGNLLYLKRYFVSGKAEEFFYKQK